MQSEQQQAPQLAPKWLQILAISAVLLLAAGYVFRLLTPTQVPVQPVLQTNYQGGANKFGQITYTGETPTLPAKLPTATINQLALKFTDFEQTLIKNYDLLPVDEIPGLWANDIYSLEKASTENIYTMTRLNAPAEKKLTDPTKAAVIAKQFLDTILPGNNFQVIESKITYRHADAHGDIVPADQAELLEIPFGYNILGVPVFFNQSITAPFTVTINSDYQVQRAVMQPFTGEIKASSEIATIPVAQAVKNITENHATIISSSYGGFENPDLSDITTGELSRVTVEYRFSPNTNVLVPYYQFSGQLTDKNGISFSATIITPAIQTKFE